MMEQDKVGAPLKRTGSRPSDQAPAGLGGSRFDPSRVTWRWAMNDLPCREERRGLIWALGRYGDVYGPLPFEIVDDDAWRGNMGCASHDLVAWAVADVDWRETFPLNMVKAPWMNNAR